jgi:hypothetical protein
LLCGCLESEADQAARAARAATLDTDDTPVANCNFDTMLAATHGILIVNGSEFSAICQTFERNLGRLPPVSVLRRIGVTAGLLRPVLKQEAVQIGYQTVAIIEARGGTSPAQMLSTADIVWKTSKGSEGRVTPQELNIALREAGPLAKTMDDDAVLMLSAIISTTKRNLGE